MLKIVLVVFPVWVVFLTKQQILKSGQGKNEHALSSNRLPSSQFLSAAFIQSNKLSFVFWLSSRLWRRRQHVLTTVRLHVLTTVRLHILTTVGQTTRCHRPEDVYSWFIHIGTREALMQLEFNCNTGLLDGKTCLRKTFWCCRNTRTFARRV